MARFERHNSDGSVFVAKTRAGIMGTLVLVSHNRIPTAGGSLLWDHPYGTRLHLVMRERLVPIRHPDYESAVSAADAVAKALAFFGTSYEDTLKHAQQEGIPVRDCYGA